MYHSKSPMEGTLWWLLNVLLHPP